MPAHPSAPSRTDALRLMRPSAPILWVSPLPLLAAMALVMSLGLASVTARAAEQVAPAAKVASAPAAEAKEKKAGTAPEARGPRDPLDVLRERLAQKLGATRVADAASPNVMRVVSKTGVPVAANAAAAAEPAGLARPRPAPHRDGGSAAGKRGSGVAAMAGGPLHGARELHAMHEAHAAPWDYSGRAGPESWGRLKPEFAKCATGSRQSPIDIRDGMKVELDPVQFDYKPSSFRVVDTGNTVQVNLGAGNSIEVMGRRYELLQFHFHRPSEERIDGKQFDMVVHLVHKDPEGRLAVVAVLLDRGSAQPIVQSVWNNLPLEKGDEVAARGTLDVAELLPVQRHYFTYMGSLTTPPCSEGVLWMVMKQPVPISAEQIGIFSRLYPMNARPVQAASGRMVKESN